MASSSKAPPPSRSSRGFRFASTGFGSRGCANDAPRTSQETLLGRGPYGAPILARRGRERPARDSARDASEPPRERAEPGSSRGGAQRGERGGVRVAASRLLWICDGVRDGADRAP